MNNLRLLCLIGALVSSSTLLAGDPDYFLEARCGTVEGELEIYLENNGDDVQGFAWGVCGDSELILDEDDVVRGDGLDGVEFSYEGITVLDDGWTPAATRKFPGWKTPVTHL